MVETAKQIRRNCGVFTTTPESVKCIVLQYLDMMHEVRTAPPEVFRNPESFTSSRQRSRAADEAARLRATAKAADLLGDLLQCLGVQTEEAAQAAAASGAGAVVSQAVTTARRSTADERGTGVVLLDEVDLLLNPMLSELNFVSRLTACTNPITPRTVSRKPLPASATTSRSSSSPLSPLYLFQCRPSLAAYRPEASSRAVPRPLAPTPAHHGCHPVLCHHGGTGGQKCSGSRRRWCCCRWLGYAATRPQDVVWRFRNQSGNQRCKIGLLERWDVFPGAHREPGGRSTRGIGSDEDPPVIAGCNPPRCLAVRIAGESPPHSTGR